MFGLNAFRSCILLVLGVAAYFFLFSSSEIKHIRQRRAPIAARDLVPLASGDGVLSPGAGAVFYRGTNLVTFTCSKTLMAVNVDLFVVQGTMSFTKEIASNATFEVAADKKSGKVFVNIPEDQPTGPNHVLRVWGWLQGHGPESNDTQYYILPDSGHFAIADKNAGTFNHPTAQESLVSGRLQTLDFTLGSAFSAVSNIRIDFTNSDWTDWYTIVDGFPLTNGATTYTYGWYVPATIRLSSHYHIRITPSSKTSQDAVSTYAVNQTPDLSAVLHSSEFTAFSAPAMNGPGFEPKVSTPWLFGQRVSYSWTYNPGDGSDLSRFSTWYVDLYNTQLGHNVSMGQRLGEVANAAGQTMVWTGQVPAGLYGGLYFIRVWAWGEPWTAATVDKVEPVSGLTKAPFTVSDSATYSAYTATITTALKWQLQTNVTVTWTYKSSSLVIADGWRVDLYRDSVPYKQYAKIISTPVDVDVRRYTFNVSTLGLSADQYGTDYRIYVYATVTSPSGKPEQIGAMSNTFEIAAAPPPGVAASSGGTSTGSSGSTSGSGAAASGGSAGNATGAGSTYGAAKSGIDMRGVLVKVAVAIVAALKLTQVI
ncbi:hypothetical protein HDU86_003305 [Geranomyces michiganensis]|nr:hypothetical protein HDU86_003305 [Geranomyces michiganensis]